MNRVTKAFQNSGAVFLYQFSVVLLSFLARKIFIETLGVTYLGYNAVFTNILSALNLTELGIGFAITSFLYKPLAGKEEERVRTLIYLYKKIYQVIGLFVAVVGFAASYLLPYFIKDASHDMRYIRMLFFMNLAGCVSTYFLSYHRTVMIANQENYITAVVDMVLNAGLTILQIICLYLYPGYEVYLILEILKSFVGNVVVTIICRKRYPYLKGKPPKELLTEYKKSVSVFVRDAFAAKMGAYVFYSTDNMIIAFFKGSVLTGFLSNYTMVVNTVQMVIVQMLTSVQSVLGNYIFTVKDKEKERKMCENYLFLNYMTGNFCMICIVMLIQPFIRLCFGEKFLLPQSTALLLGINLLLIVISQMPSQLFSIYQLFRYDKYIVAVSALLNIFISIALAGPLGIDGVLIGTFFTSLIYIFSRIAIIWKKIFCTSAKYLYVKIGMYFLGSLANLLAAGVISWLIPVDSLKTGQAILQFVLRSFLIAVSAAAVPVLLFYKTKEEKFFIDKCRKQLRFRE